MEEGRLVWGSAGNEVKGELVVKKMRFTITSLERQVCVLKEERETLRSRFEEQVSELQRRYENELLLQRAAMNNEVSMAKLVEVDEHVSADAKYEAQLRELAAGLAEHAEVFSSGSPDDLADPLTLQSQVVSLRQALDAHKAALTHAGAVQTKLRSELDQAHAAIRKEQDETVAVHLQYSRMDADLVGEIQALIGGEPLGPDGEGMAPLTARERGLLRVVRQLRFSASEAGALSERTIEDLKSQLLAARADTVSVEALGKDLAAVEAELLAEHDVDALKNQIETLRAANAYLRAAGGGVPSLGARQDLSSDDLAAAEARNGALLKELQALARVPSLAPVSGTLFSLFWQLVGENKVLVTRAGRHKEDASGARARVAELEKQLGEVQTSFAQELASALETARSESEALLSELVASNSDLSVRLNFATAAHEQAAAEVATLEGEAAENRRASLVDDAARFRALFRKWSGARAEVQRLSLRENVWKQLCDALQSMVGSLSEASGPAQGSEVARELSRVQSEVVAHINQLNALARPSTAEAATAGEVMETTAAVAEALALAHDQIEAEADAGNALRAQVGQLKASITELTVRETGALRAQDEAASRLAFLESKVADLSAANEALAARSGANEERARARVFELDSQVADLSAALKEERALWASIADTTQQQGRSGSSEQEAQENDVSVAGIIANLQSLLPTTGAASRVVAASPVGGGAAEGVVAGAGVGAGPGAMAIDTRFPTILP